MSLASWSLELTTVTGRGDTASPPSKDGVPVCSRGLHAGEAAVAVPP